MKKSLSGTAGNCTVVLNPQTQIWIIKSNSVFLQPLLWLKCLFSFSNNVQYLSNCYKNRATAMWICRLVKSRLEPLWIPGMCSANDVWNNLFVEYVFGTIFCDIYNYFRCVHDETWMIVNIILQHAAQFRICPSVVSPFKRWVMAEASPKTDG